MRTASDHVERQREKLTDKEEDRVAEIRAHHQRKKTQVAGTKGNVGVSRICPNFWVPPIISGMGKATNFKFCTVIFAAAQLSRISYSDGSQSAGLRQTHHRPSHYRAVLRKSAVMPVKLFVTSSVCDSQSSVRDFKKNFLRFFEMKFQKT